MSYDVFSLYYDKLTENVDYSKRAIYFDKLIKKYCKSEGNVLLDLACGTGSMSEEMAKLNYDVLGVDYSYGMLNQAMQKKIENNLPIQYICQDIRNLDLYGTVDVAICTLDSLNHLESLDEVQMVFSSVFENLEDGGVFVFDMNTPYKHQYVLGNQIYIYDTETVYCVWENQFEPENNTVHIRLDFFEKQEDDSYLRSDEVITERAYSQGQVQDALEKVGFTVKSCYHADTENPLNSESERMVFVVVKERRI